MNLSIIEFLVYGGIAYSTLLMLLILMVKAEFPNTKKNSALRVSFIMPGIICAGVLMFSGVDIILEESISINSTNSTYTYSAVNENDTVIKEITTVSQIEDQKKISLLDPVWQTIHFLIFILFLIYAIYQILQMLVDQR